MPPGPAYMLTGAGAACSVIAACLWLARVRPGDWLEPFTAAGRMTLTLYVGHILLGMGTLESWACSMAARRSHRCCCGRCCS